jgi:hypothetical protein
MGREKRLDGEGTRYVFSAEVEKLLSTDEQRDIRRALAGRNLFARQLKRNYNVIANGS